MNMPGSVPSLHTASGSATMWTSDSCVAPPPSFFGGGGEWPAAATAAAAENSARRSMPRAGARQRHPLSAGMPSARESGHGVCEREGVGRECVTWQPHAAPPEPMAAAPQAPAPAQGTPSTPPLVVVSQNALPQTLSYLQARCCSLCGTWLWHPLTPSDPGNLLPDHRAVASRSRACRPRSVTWNRSTTSCGSAVRVLTACSSSRGTPWTRSCSSTWAPSSSPSPSPAAGACGVPGSLLCIVTRFPTFDAALTAPKTCAHGASQCRVG